MGIGPMHLFVLAAVVLLFFGPSKLPGLGKSMGEALKGFKKAMNDVNSEVEKISSDVAAPSAAPKQHVPHAIDAAVEVTETSATSEILPDQKPKTPVS